MAEPHPLPLLEERPLVTFALFAYNQEKFICEAIEGAFSQTYEPLEIILSDDYSTDGTFEIMQTMASSYCGPHKIILNKNEKNLGIGAHVNLVLKMAHGAWIVMAAGDDVSLPDRTYKTMVRALDMNQIVDCVSVELAEINEDNKKTGHIRNRITNRSSIGASTLAGAGLAYSHRVVKLFGDIKPAVHNEDVVLSARALLLSGIGFVPEPLVHYRSHEKNRPKKNRRINNFDSAWIKSKYLYADRTNAMFEQVRLDALNLDTKQIPDFQELAERANKARILKDLIDYNRPKYLKDIVTLASDLALIKCYLGILFVGAKKQLIGIAGCAR